MERERETERDRGVRFNILPADAALCRDSVETRGLGDEEYKIFVREGFYIGI